MKYWVKLVQFALFNRLPQTIEEVPLWSMTVPYRTWRRPVRFDGKTFGDLYGASVDPLGRRILPLRFFYLVYLWLLPLLTRLAWRRPDLAASHPGAKYSERDLAWSRPDYSLGMAYALEHAFAPKPFFRLDDKREFLIAATAAGLPLPPSLSIDEAIAEGGTYIVKRPTSSLGFGVRLRTADEIAEKRDPTWIIQRRLRNHPALREVFGDDAPLSSFRVITQRNPDTGALDVARVAIRIGRAGSAVDNTMQGGIWANIDEAAGTILPGVTKAAFKSGKRFDAHPDTGKRFVGVTIPWFDEGRALAIRAHEALAPEAPTLGWDVALCEGSPVLLEVNVWTVCYDYDVQSDAFTPACKVLLQRVPTFF